MMSRLFATILLLLIMPVGMVAQKNNTKKKDTTPAKPQTESREVKQLRDEQSSVRQQMQNTQKEIDGTAKDTEIKQRQVSYIEKQLDDRVRYIHKLQQRIDSTDRATVKLEADIDIATRNLRDKKFKYAEGLRYARSQQLKGGNMGMLWFALQASTWQQMYRRARYAREYASHQQTLGRQIMAQQDNLHKKKSQLLAYKNEMSQLLADITLQRQHLMDEHRTQQQVLGGLKKKQKSLVAEMEKHRQRLNELDKKIDQVIAREIEAARKRAEAAERKRREAEAKARRKAAAANKSSNTNASSNSKATTSNSKATTSNSKATTSNSKGSASKPAATKPSNNAAGNRNDAFITSADRELSGSFERNKGRLPVPITGPYRIGASMGVHQVMKGVQLENKGTNYIGKRGACARAIFNGEVTAIFTYGGMTNVLVRHGSYISVYCNLSSVRVHEGQKVKTNELLGAVDTDERGETTLLFQLRREKVRLNPEAWIGR